MARVDAERENQGESLLSFWRIDMFDFWERRHYKYLGFAHRLLAGDKNFHFRFYFLMVLCGEAMSVIKQSKILAQDKMVG